MAQLIKLQDYISRYEIDFYRYPGQFIRLKKENWHKVYEHWELNQPRIETPEELETSGTKESFSLKNLFIRRKEKDLFAQPSISTEQITDIPRDEEQLKHKFLDHIFRFQLKWASSTIREQSELSDDYKYSSTLKFLLQRLPDSFLVLYQPIFRLKNATVEGDIIIITPLSVLCLTFLDEGEGVKIIPKEGRTWFVEQADVQSRILSPLISLKRTEHIIKSIFAKYDIDMPVKKVVISEKNEMVTDMETYNTNYIGEGQYEEWFTQLRKLSSPLKHVQLKAGEALLKHCQTTSFERPEWLEDEEPTMFDLM
ncbi:nuclease-related domain-containing protein [Salinibacillus xinjiangensis]|uniref:NERD domain-containing protein n=1 Tax=Salinibacillus xinjiangensis TaxID=1229268 RepID=A0A6G1X9Z5_9BACI|nr:nuclease-related domain-containing protein [Salinibacillus xinjiangensis]MRG87749.1 NERD domain-containing protein [Salinibacillus xinjiangensis]